MKIEQTNIGVKIIIGVLSCAFLLFVGSKIKTWAANGISGFNYPQLEQALRASEVDSVTIHPDSGEVSGVIKSEFESKYHGKKFRIAAPTDNKMYEFLQAFQITPSYERDHGSVSVLGFILNTLSMLFVLGVYWVVEKK